MRDKANSDRTARRQQELLAARRVFALTLGLNLSVSVAKLIWGFLTNTLSMVADGFHSLLDASSNIVGIVGVTISSRPPDSGHPYGHRKFDALAAIVISFLMFLASYEVLSECIARLWNQSESPPSVSAISYVVMFVTMAINIWVSRYESKRGRELRSELLLADSKHTMSDVYATVGVLISLVSIQLNFPIIDTIASIAIVGAILRAGYEIISTHLGSLVDAAIVDAEEIERIVLSVPGVESCHKIRSRGMQDAIFIDLHVQVPPETTIREAHAISYDVEDKLASNLDGVVDVLVHLEDTAGSSEAPSQDRRQD